MVGGCCAFWGALIVGRRIGKVFKGEDERELRQARRINIFNFDGKIE